MTLEELFALSIFASYFLLIFLSFYFVFRSILHDVKVSALFTGRPFLFLRTAVGALLCTWYFMFKFMNWSYSDFASRHPVSPSIAQWLVHTPLFEQAWSTVCATPLSWWWTSGICTWTVILTAFIWRESSARGIPHAWAYMLLGQLVAISVATSLFLTALFLHPHRALAPAEKAPLRLYLPLVLAMLTIYLTPTYANTPHFLQNLLGMHVLLLVPLLFPSNSSSATAHSRSTVQTFAIPFSAMYTLLVGLAGFIHLSNTLHLPAGWTWTRLYTHIFAHPAQSSVSFDVIWVGLTLAAFFLSTGSPALIATKILASLVVVGSLVLGTIGITINWPLVLSILPIILLLSLGIGLMGINRLRSRNDVRRREVLAGLGVVEEDGVVPGTRDQPPRMGQRKRVVGFWHPFCNAGGGGERVLWSAIAYLQRTEPQTIILVYSGDYPSASKEQILAKAKDRFSISLKADTMAFIPLPARYMMGDQYWQRFTLLGQSFGSIVCAWQGACGKDGVWGDIFIDTMGNAFTYPFLRLICGPQLVIGAYVHYPLVSSDMVKRVRERSFGVENAGASDSWLRTQLKLIYYRILTSLYGTSLLFSQYTMTNSSWTQAHIQSLLTGGRQSFLASLLLMDEKALRLRRAEEERIRPQVKTTAAREGTCEVVYPPCDTAALVGAKLEGRSREIVSLAQFRPEKDQAKQLQALAELFDAQPQYRGGEGRVNLTLMGGARDAADEARVTGLKGMAERLGVADNVEFVVNAPYGEIVRRLGQASIGVNTMMDEHFGINVVEFMAAGLIPVVHASAGPILDIVVPYKRQRTGLHAKSAEEFASALYEALSMSPAQQKTMRQAARKLAVERFGLGGFEQGWKKGWQGLCALVDR